MFTLEFDNILEVQEALKVLCYFKVDVDLMSQYPETDVLWPMFANVKAGRGLRREMIVDVLNAFESEGWTKVAHPKCADCGSGKDRPYVCHSCGTLSLKCPSI
jgi:hypothetical protein